MGILDQEEENIRGDMTTSENSELTQDKLMLLTWYRKLSYIDRGYILHIVQALAGVLRL